MRSSNLLSLLSIVTIAHALPYDDGQWHTTYPPDGVASSTVASSPSSSPTSTASPGGIDNSAGNLKAAVEPGNGAQPSVSATSISASGVAAPSGSPAVSTDGGSPPAVSTASGSPPEPSSTASPATSGGSGNGTSGGGGAAFVSGGGSANGLGNNKKPYSGDGSVGAGWPTKDNWISDFDTMWTNNVPLIKSSCDPASSNIANLAPTLTRPIIQDELDSIQSSIVEVSNTAQMDARLILAIIMQESKGCPQVKTTKYSVDNPGLMQDYNGSASCVGIEPCPKEIILQMITEGTSGTAAGPGLVKDMQDAVTAGGDVDPAKYYRTARIYNSGSWSKGVDLVAGGSTSSYASDVANRLTGWVG